MDPIDIGTADRLIRHHFRMREGRGRVLAKNPDGRTLQVDVFGKGVTDCATERGVWGAVRVGDRVKVDTRTVPTVTGTYERFESANMMQIVGEDTRPITITSHTSWEEINRVEDLAIPGPGFVIIHWHCHAQLVAPNGPGEMEVRFKINDELPQFGPTNGVFVVGPTSPATERTVSFPLWLGSYTTSGMKYQERMLATFIQATVFGVVDVEVVNSISVEGRTMDTENGTDYLQGQHLRVFA